MLRKGGAELDESEQEEEWKRGDLFPPQTFGSSELSRASQMPQDLLGITPSVD